MKQVILLALAAALILLAWFYLRPMALTGDAAQQFVPAAESVAIQPGPVPPAGDEPVKAVLDISVHTIEGLRVLFDRAEELAMRPRAQGTGDSVVLVLHGPEVEFFSIRNYEKYKDIVDQAARLDAFDVVDVKICQTMMGVRGIAADDIPAFIEQVPLGSEEVRRLLEEGYVAF